MAYAPHRILITGGSGFIASHVASRIVEEYPMYEVSHALTCPAQDTALTFDADNDSRLARILFKLEEHQEVARRGIGHLREGRYTLGRSRESRHEGSKN